MNRWLACLWLLLPLSTPALAGPFTSADTIRAERILAGFGTITSMYRTVAHNRAVGGVPNSYHLLGRAIDVVRRRGITHRAIDAALRSAGFSLIESLDEHDHSHFAFAGVVAASPAHQARSSAPPPLRLLADDHGTLWSDLRPSRPQLRSEAGK